MYGPKGPGKDDCIKKLEKGNMRISPSGMHDQMMFFIISNIYVLSILPYNTDNENENNKKQMKFSSFATTKTNGME